MFIKNIIKVSLPNNKLQDTQTSWNWQTWRVCCSWFLHVKSKLRIKFAYLVFIIFDPSLLHGLVSNTNSILCWSYWYKRYGHHSTIQPTIQDFNWYICYLDSTGISHKTSQVGYRFGFFVWSEDDSTDEIPFYLNFNT